MTNPAEVKELVEALTPAGRATVAFLAASRLADICTDERFETYFASGPSVFGEAMATSAALARGDAPSVGLAPVLDRITELLGPPGEEYEEPEYEGTWFLDALAAANYTTRAWAEPDDSVRWCNNAISCLSSSVDFLARELRDNQLESTMATQAGSTADLTRLEEDRQREDIRAIGSSTEDQRRAVVDELVRHSRELARSYNIAYRVLTTSR